METVSRLVLSTPIYSNSISNDNTMYEHIFTISIPIVRRIEEEEKEEKMNRNRIYIWNNNNNNHSKIEPVYVCISQFIVKTLKHMHVMQTNWSSLWRRQVNEWTMFTIEMDPVYHSFQKKFSFHFIPVFFLLLLLSNEQ